MDRLEVEEGNPPAVTVNKLLEWGQRFYRPECHRCLHAAMLIHANPETWCFNFLGEQWVEARLSQLTCVCPGWLGREAWE